MKEQPIRALGLSSGGLDSILSALVLKQQGIEVEWISFETPFFSASKAIRAAHLTGIPITVQDITQAYIEMLKNPHCGYGKHMNPCMDCHALMFKIAGKQMIHGGFDFLFSGEVLGQRPMSQTSSSLRYVEKQSGYEGYILRPLSAKKLPETIPEKKGLVKRALLFDFSGRSRKPQMELARQLNVSEYPSPAGGCLLTEESFSKRLRDLFQHQEKFTQNDLHLLKYGRHLRLTPQTKLIVGRMKNENDTIMSYYNPKSDMVLKIQSFPGPTVLIPGGCPKELLPLSASICLHYSKAPDSCNILVTKPDGQESIQPIRVPSEVIKKFII